MSEPSINEFIVRPNALEVLPTLVEHYGEPYADPSAIPTYYVSRETRKHVTVALNGDGGDESFVGYERHVAMKYRRAAIRKLRAPFRRSLIEPALGAIPAPTNFRNRFVRFQRFLRAASMPKAERYFRLAQHLRRRGEGGTLHQRAGVKGERLVADHLS